MRTRRLWSGSKYKTAAWDLVQVMDSVPNSTSFANSQGVFPPHTSQLTGGSYSSSQLLSGFAKAEHSFQNYGLPQVTGAAPTQWAGGANFSRTLSDPEFWLSLRISVIFAAVVVPLTLLTGTLVGLLLNRLGPKMSRFVSSAAMLAWATPAVSASVIFIWLTDPDGGVVDWTLSKVPPGNSATGTSTTWASTHTTGLSPCRPTTGWGPRWRSSSRSSC